MERSAPLIQPVVLAGGTGTRLWPSSRPSLPKQFAGLLAGESLYQATLRRVSGPLFAPPLILTGETSRFLAAEQAEQIEINAARIVLEPDPRDTAPAILVAALINEEHPDTFLLITPSDHLIADDNSFLQAVSQGVDTMPLSTLVCFGATPDRPETGYGYMELGEERSPGVLRNIRKFIEKPPLPEAERMLASGNHWWNAGIYLSRVADILAAYERYAPHLIPICRSAISTATRDPDFMRLGACYERAEAISIDFAVMEKADNLQAVLLPAGWSDLGSWEGMRQALPTDAHGVAISGSVTSLDCQKSILRSEDETIHLVGLGLDGIAAIATRDAVLVADLNKVQDIRKVTAELAEKGIAQAQNHPRQHRPWGWYETLCLGARFQVKRIMVKPGGALSLQSHIHRAEHWVVVAGTAQVTIGNDVKLLSENQSIYVPLGAVHRLENPGKLPVYLIEVQTGAYLGEDDITRHADAYNRCVAE